MKKIITFIIVSAMTVGLVACGGKDDANTTTTTTPGTTTEAPTTTPANQDAIITPDFNAGSAGEKLWNAFLDGMKANPATTPEEMANVLVTNPVIQFMGGAMPVEAGGYLAGFDKEITGFNKGAVYMPMMGSIAFVGYVFELPADVDVNAFIKTLNDNCNPSWNVCVTADYVLSGAYNNTVFFLMYPKELDNADAAGGDAAADAVIVEPAVEAGTWGETLWNAFKTNMNDNPSATAVDAAFIVSMDESIPMELMMGSAEIIPGYLAGFNEEITGFKSGAMFGPMIGSIPFVGYVFELEDGADVNAFISTLAEQANPRWNICVAAEQTVIGAYNNKVFFLMCKTSNQAQ